MKVQHLFKTSNIAFVKITSKEDRSSIQTYARSNGCSAKMREGIWINPKTCETEKVTKVEIIGELPKRNNQMNVKIMLINKLKDEGFTMKDIAKKMNLSRARLYQIIEAEKIENF